MTAQQAVPLKDPKANVAVSIRRARVTDARSLASLQDQANDGHLSAVRWKRDGSAWIDVGAHEIASDQNEMGYSSTIVADWNGSVVGMLNYAANENISASGSPVDRPFLALRQAIGSGLYLRSMAVEPRYGGRGFASLLLDTAANAARAMNAAVIGVIVHERNERLIRHYLSRGYVPTSEERVVRHHSYPTGTKLVALRLSLNEREH